MNRFQGTNSARLCSLAGRYNNPVPTRFLAHIDCLKIPARAHTFRSRRVGGVLHILYTYSVQSRTYAVGIEIGWNHLRTRGLQFMPMSCSDL
jgi:hypothetical protein